MLSGWLLSALAVAYLGCLFAIAFYGDKRALYARNPRLRPYIYGLALGVYCTSWTFFGAVGTAVREGWAYLPIYLGPSLVFVFALPFLERLAQIGRAHKVTSIADFIASRFGKSRSLAVLITVIATTAAVPYLALQYKAVAASIVILTTPVGAVPWYRDDALAVALLMALFAVLFGARRADASERREGLMVAIAFESLLKLLAFVAVGVFAYSHLGSGPLPLPPHLMTRQTLLNGDALMATALAAAAIFCLPRQFQIGVVECVDPADLKVARWVMPAYLGLFSTFVLPVVALGSMGHLLSRGAADVLILTLPMSYGLPWLTILVFLGGLSAATAMVVVASIALSTMISNDIVAPLLWRQRLEAGASLARRVLWVRRAVIVSLALVGFAYYRATAGSASLASIGLLAFAAVAQFAPGLLTALYWNSATRAGVFWGMLAGFLVWAYLLFLPNLLTGGFITAPHFLPPPALAWLWPQALIDPLSWGTVGPGALLALMANVIVMVAVSMHRGVTLQERLAARTFLIPKQPTAGLPAITASVGDLETVAARMMGTAAARQALVEYAVRTGQSLHKPADLADRGLLQHFERVIAGSIGSSSARVVLTHALKRKGLEFDEVAELLDETSQELRFSRQLLQATMENVSQAISVVDADMRIVAWNRRYVEMFGYPPGMVFVGRPVEHLIRWNLARGEFGDTDAEQHVQKRLAHLRAGTPYTFQRVRRNGQVYRIQGQPMLGGGFVTTYTDVTDFKRTEQALLEAKQGLEERVAQRTHELREALEAQRLAKQEAERANSSKTRFVAAASHDLLQPLNAARLFASALEARARRHPELLELATRVDDSMRAAEELLSDLLDVARLDIGVLKPDITVFQIGDLLEELRRQYGPVAHVRNLRLDAVGCRDTVRTDRVLLRRIIQNYLSNALRYTERGGVALGCRRRGAELEITVYDTGPGIPSDQQQRIYGEFHRLEQGSPWGERGVGLGLSICDRLARLLGHELSLHSRSGRGSAFGVRVPRDVRAAQPHLAVPLSPAANPTGLKGLRVLCVDNDPAILDGMQALLGLWGVQVHKARSGAEALAAAAKLELDAVLVDYHLGEGMNGLELLRRLNERRDAALPGGLITADHAAEIALAARMHGYPVLHKPVRPAALRALLAAARRRATGRRPQTLTQPLPAEA
jgi:PAS domain S-box-containing protein